MKKVLILFVSLLVLIPINVFATVDGTTKGLQFPASTDAKANCMAEEAKNTTDFSAADSGNYLYCIAITCTNSVNVFTADNPLSSKVTCKNGNTKPYITVASSGAGAVTSGPSYAEGSSCTDTSGVPYEYVTENDFFECAFTYGGTDNKQRVAYLGSSNNTTNNTSSNTSSNSGSSSGSSTSGSSTSSTGSSTSSTSSKDSTSSPNTGVENYFVILVSAIVALSILLYILNKKNVFKKI
jgi:cobalamin biosynthesis Mg chelatase CobN